MRQPAPERPRTIDPLAEALLTRLHSFPAARHIVLGGYFALKHYCDYRITHVVDAWWAEESRDLWKRKNPDLNPADAQAEVARHLHEIELRRPLDSLTDPAQREQAQQTRSWFKAEFLRSSPA